MPIRPDLRHHYGPQWLKEIRPSILARANYRCEQCGKRNRTVVETVTCPFHELEPRMYWRELKRFNHWHNFEGQIVNVIFEAQRIREVLVVLTIAHLDHDPSNTDDKNLKALCQWCHLNYDRLHHAQTRAERKDAARPLLVACSVVTDRENESASRGGTAAPRPAEPSRSERP